MANFKSVNTAIKKEFKELDIEVSRGYGYVYFNGDDGFDKIDSIHVSPTSITTEDLIRICFEEIRRVYKK